MPSKAALAALGFGHALGVTWRNLRFTGVDLRRQLVTLGLNEFVGAGAGYAFQLFVQGVEGHARRQVVAIGIEQAAQGSGGAGLAAAIRASDAGARVVIIEKMPTIGGNTIKASVFLQS